MADGNQSYDDYNIYDEGQESPGFLTRVWAFFSGFKERFNWKAVLIAAAVIIILPLLAWAGYALLSGVNDPGTPSETLPAVSVIEVRESVVLPRTDTTALGVVRLKNSETNYGMPALKYSWKAADGAGEEMASGTGSTYILPDQEKYILIPFTEAKPLALKFEITSGPEDFQRLASAKEVILDRVNVQNMNRESNFVMSGAFLNKSAYVVRVLDIVGLIKDASGRLVGAVSTQVNDLEPNAIKGYELLWPKNLPETSIVEVRTGFNLFNDFNFPLPVSTEAR